MPPQEGYLPTMPRAVSLSSRVLVVSVTGKVVHTACGLGVTVYGNGMSLGLLIFTHSKKICFSLWSLVH